MSLSGLSMRGALAALLFMLSALATAAQEATVAFGGRGDPQALIEVTADTLDVSQQDGRAEYAGNVLVGQGEMRMAAERLLVIYDEEKRAIARLEARGGVTLVNGPDAAEAEAADYDVASGQVELTGDVLLTQGPNAISAERMSLDLEKGTARLTGRVRTILVPEER
ncbi:LptA/OstA family protein [Pontibaca methylaminivorans]|uniref:Lipopolysaccharide export system protein LptA n=1 Tax=Pontibaca methylaminivorans TaxID=515897 RepID=A0A1R3X3F1_9RHOB|nr:lipopolysaccharide export system protein LptA [Pontibaca methylaminivorans]